MIKDWRLELFFKTDVELRAKVIPFLKNSAVQRINLTNKAKEDRLLDSARALRAELPAADICVHFSCKYNYDRTVDASFRRLEQLAEGLSELVVKPVGREGREGGSRDGSSGGNSSAGSSSSRAGSRAGSMETGGEVGVGGGVGSGVSILLVSGGGKKRQLDSLKALELAAGRKAFHQLGVPFYVAFNPYFPDADDREEERRRLRAKVLRSKGLVAGVYVQMGTDLERLQEGLQFLQQLQAEVASSGSSGKWSLDGGGGDSGSSRTNSRQRQHPPLCLLGSVFIPSKRLLAQMRFRPWNGVFLSEEYLSSVEAAEAITQRLLDVYGCHGVVPLVETAVKSEGELSHMQELLRLRSDKPVVSAGG